MSWFEPSVEALWSRRRKSKGKRKGRGLTAGKYTYSVGSCSVVCSNLIGISLCHIGTNLTPEITSLLGDAETAFSTGEDDRAIAILSESPKRHQVYLSHIPCWL